MRVFRHLANWVYERWSRSFLRLKRPGRYLKRRINRRCLPWVDSAHRFLLQEGVSTPAAKGNAKDRVRDKAREKRAKQSNAHLAKRSTGQDLMASGVNNRLWAVTLLAVLLLTACFGQRFYNQPGLDIRSVATQSFYAPEQVAVEDKKETENLRNNVRNGAVQVLRIDPDLTEVSVRSLETLLRQGRALREQAGNPPFLNLDTLSRPTQDFLFQASDHQWRTVWRLAEMPVLSSEQLVADRQPQSTLTPSALPSKVIDQVRSLSSDQAAALQELVGYRERLNAKALSLLKTRMDTRRQQYRKAANTLAAAASTDDQPLYNYRLFELSDEQWYYLEDSSRQIFNEMMLQGVHPGVPSDLLRRAIEARVSGATPEVRDLTADVLAAAISPNLELDEERTRLRAQQAVDEINPVMVSVQKGDLIVREGDIIDSSDFALLDYFDLTGRFFNWLGLCGFSLLVICAVAGYLWVDHHQVHRLNPRDHCLVLMLGLAVAVLAALRGVPTVGLPAVGLLVGSFYGSMLGVSVVGLLTLLLLVGAPVTITAVISGAAGAMLGTWIAPNLRSREEFALLGGFVGLGQASVHLILTLMRSTVAAPLWQAIFVGSALHGLYGIVWSVVALGVSPYLEHFFDVVTPIRLAELANPNRPLLKRLASEAPGTFQHTMFVANLAEAAARALGRNVELVRAGTLYHDIGKMHDPQGFIENQISGPNKHDLIDDPWESARIIKKHVTQGLVMARKYRLPKAVQAFIPEHQGDMKISYFYQQAKERQKKEPSLVITPSDFSYDGPIPQSPETGITMLADSCEAALRSLKPEASMDEAYAMVDKILRARWRNRQLVESGLIRDDMDVIASVFIQVWQQHNHKRISYPQNVVAGR
ncbi:MAG: HDIG domain-containing metalloprotein [Cyanobacteria bacterium J06598_3]